MANMESQLRITGWRDLEAVDPRESIVSVTLVLSRGPSEVEVNTAEALSDDQDVFPLLTVGAPRLRIDRVEIEEISRRTQMIDVWLGAIQRKASEWSSEAEFAEREARRVLAELFPPAPE